MELSQMDVGVRKLPELMESDFVGGFMKEGVCATLATSLFYPLDYFKSRIQAGVSGYFIPAFLISLSLCLSPSPPPHCSVTPG